MPARLALLALSGLVVSGAFAQETEQPRPILNGLTLRNCTFEVKATDELATVVVEQVFYNGGGGLREADFLFPMPVGAAATGLELKMGGRYYGGNLLTRGKARRIYDEITRRSRDPAILDCVGRDLYRCRVFPVPARDVASVRFSYRQPLGVDGAMRRLVIPLDASRFNRRAADRFRLAVEIRTEKGLQALVCPTHEVSIRRRGARKAIVELEARHAFLARELVLLYSVDDAPMGAIVASHRGRAGGYFVLTVDAAFARERQARAPRDVVLGIDTSNSAGRAGVDQAASAVAEALGHLGPDDRFALMTFGTDARVVSGFQPARPETPAMVRALFARQPVAGRTRLSAALRGAAALAETARPGAGIVLVTDGVVTEGAAAVSGIARETADRGNRVGLCGVGQPLDTARLDALGESGEGDSAYAVRGRGLPASVRYLLDTTRQAPLTDVEVEVPGALDVYPPRIRLVKADDVIVVAGRYVRPGPVEILVRGRVAGEPVTRRIVATFRKRGGDPALARLWAARRIGHLLADARAQGDPDLYRKSILALGKRFGIVTPFTSLLVLEQEDQRRFLNGLRRRPLLQSDGGTIRRRSYTREAVSEAELAERIKRLQRCASGAANPFEDLLGSNRLRVRRAGDRTFYRLDDGTWVEAGLVDRIPAEPREVAFLSDEWMELARSDPETAQALAVGRSVLLRLADGRFLRVVP